MSKVETLKAAAQPHIWTDTKGRAWVDQTNVKVVEIIRDHMAYGWSAEEMHYHHPHLSLAQIHSALAYYYDHENDLDKEIEDSLSLANKLAGESVRQSPLRNRLRRLGKI